MVWGDYELGPTGIRLNEVPAWRSDGSRIVFEHRFHSALVDEQVALPDGSKGTWIRHADARHGIGVRGAAGRYALEPAVDRR